MKTITKHIDDLHFEHKLWTNQLLFNKDEVKTFNNRLEEIVKRYSDKDILAKLEQLQNKYIWEVDIINSLLEKIKTHESDLVKEYKNNPVAIEHKHFDDHGLMRDEVEQYTKLYSELKKRTAYILIKIHVITNKSNLQKLPFVMYITDKKTIKQVKDEFHEKFPYLKIEFFNHEHKTEQLSPLSDVINENNLIFDSRNIHSSGDIFIHRDMTVGDVENKFKFLFGLNAQIFRRSGDLWIETSVTDNWTLDFQNNTAKEMLNKDLA